MTKRTEDFKDKDPIHLALSADRELLAAGGIAANAALKRWQQSRRAAAQLAASGRLGVESMVVDLSAAPNPDMRAENTP